MKKPTFWKSREAVGWKRFRAVTFAVRIQPCHAYDCQGKVDKAFQDQRFWIHMSILNVARMGKFSSDRSIREYAERIWKVKPYPKDSG